MKPLVAIVGRPNVGKSTLLNRLAKRRVSITHPKPGVTRDRIGVELDFDGCPFELVDTGGVGIVDRQDLHPDIHEQIDNAIARARLILFLVDARFGPHPMDIEVAERLRREKVPVLLLANKSETEVAKQGISEFYQLGVGDPQPISAEHGEGITDLIDSVREYLTQDEETWGDPALRIAIVGRRNAGKSTFINALLQEERVIVSDVPGTTRDAVDVRFKKDEQEIVLIDTAGMQRRSKLKGDLEHFAQVRSIEAIQRCDVAIFVIDAVHGVSQLDKRIAHEIAARHRACVIAVNKWDLAKEKTSTEEYEDYLWKILPGMRFAPVLFMTAKTGRNALDAISVSQSLARQGMTRVGTGELNRAVTAIKEGQRPRFRAGKEPKIYFASQVAVLPPTIVMMVNKPGFFSNGYRRFIENRLRELLPYREIPIHVVYRKRDSLYHD